jgi:RNA polymerase sigma-70 factor, ECF subfamily
LAPIGNIVIDTANERGTPVADAVRITRQKSFTEDRQPDDQALARRIATGDQGAWEAFYAQYSPWVYRFAYHHLAGHRADAEDLTSEILITAARSITGYNAARGAIDVWLLGIARHCLARFCRTRRMQVPLVPQIKDGHGEIEEPFDETTLTSTLVKDTVNRTLASLPARQAEILIGKYIRGYSVDELAQAGGLSAKAVESLLTRARVAFRAAFRALDGGGRGKQNE